MLCVVVDHVEASRDGQGCGDRNQGGGFALNVHISPMSEGIRKRRQQMPAALPMCYCCCAALPIGSVESPGGFPATVSPAASSGEPYIFAPFGRVASGPSEPSLSCGVANWSAS